MTNNLTKNSIKLGVMALALGTLGAGAIASAYQGDPTVTGPNYSADRHEAMEKAFAEEDYSAWKELMSGKGRVTQVVNEDNFAQFARAHELALAGDIEGANEIRSELGLGQGQRRGDGTGVGARGAKQGQHRNVNR